MKPKEERAPRLGSARVVQKTHRKFASKKTVGIGGHELGQRRMLWGVGSAMLTALRNFLTADEVVITRICRCHAAPGRSSRRRCKQANTPTTSISRSLVISVGLLIIGECSGFCGCGHLLDRGGLPVVRRGFIAGSSDECWLLWDWWTPSLVLVRQSPGTTCSCTCRTQLSPGQQGATHRSALLTLVKSPGAQTWCAVTARSRWTRCAALSGTHAASMFYKSTTYVIN